jgi:hypothetical protein
MKPKSPSNDASAAAESRVAAALRDNLRKRREQSRLRGAQSSRDLQQKAQLREAMTQDPNEAKAN